jgi:hypothetical protein
MKGRLLVAVIGFAIGATLVGGVSVAASKSSSQAKACVSGKGALTLLSKHGKCSKGSQKLTINARGVPGARGAKGRPGAAGPGARTTAANGNVTVTADTGNTITIKGTDLGVYVDCSNNDHAYVGILGADDYFVRGSAIWTGVGVVASSDIGDSPNAQSPGSPGLISYENHDSDAGSVSTVSVQTGQGQASVQLIVTDGTVTATVQAMLLVDSQDCHGIATVTPSTA